MCFNKPRDKGLSLPCALGLPSNSADYTRLAPANAAGGGGGLPSKGEEAGGWQNQEKQRHT